MNDHAAGFTGTIPENYETGLGPHIFSGFGKELAKRVAAEKPSSVLELAAGTGIVTRYLRDALPGECELVATDLSQPMLDVAEEKFTRDMNISFASADAMELPYTNEAFEVITSQFGVMFFPDKVASFREARRVLRPGGSYIFNTWDTWEGNPFARIAHETVKLFFPDDPPQFYKVPFSYADMLIAMSDLKEAGFDRITTEPVELEQEIDYPSFCRGLIYGNPLYEEITERGGDPEEVLHAVDTALKLQFGKPGKMPLRAWYITAVRGLRFART